MFEKEDMSKHAFKQKNVFVVLKILSCLLYFGVTIALNKVIKINLYIFSDEIKYCFAQTSGYNKNNLSIKKMNFNI